MASSKTDLMELAKRETKLVEIAGKEFRVQSLTDHERAMWEVDCLNESGERDPVAMESMRPRLIVKCLVDDGGNRLFTDEEAEDVAGLPASVTVKLFTVCSDLCGMDDDDKKDAAKN